MHCPLFCRAIEGAADALRALQEKFRFIVVTSRQLAIESQTRDWLAMHFSGIFEDVLLANHYAKSGEKKCVPTLRAMQSTCRHPF